MAKGSARTDTKQTNTLRGNTQPTQVELLNHHSRRRPLNLIDGLNTQRVNNLFPKTSAEQGGAEMLDVIRNVFDQLFSARWRRSWTCLRLVCDQRNKNL